MGLKSDGTVVAVGMDDYGQCDVGGWWSILLPDGSNQGEVGPKPEPTAPPLESKRPSRLTIAAGYEHTVGLKSDGTVVAIGWNQDGQCNVGGWTGIMLP